MAITNKVVSRVVGGITGKGAKHVNPVYRNIPQDNVKIVLGNKAPVLRKDYEKQAELARSKQLLRRAKEETRVSESEAKANARGLKAANEPVSSGNSGKRNFKRGLTPPARPNRRLG